jgi:hypothetical protein
MPTDESIYNDAVPFQLVIAFYREHDRDGTHHPGKGEWVYQWGYARRMMYRFPNPQLRFSRAEIATEIVWDSVPQMTKHYPSGDEWERKELTIGPKVIESESAQKSLEPGRGGDGP